MNRLLVYCTTPNLEGKGLAEEESTKVECMTSAGENSPGRQPPRHGPTEEDRPEPRQL